MIRIWIEKQAGKILQRSREVLAETFNGLPDGGYQVVIEEKKQGYTPTRYRYYFVHIVKVILLTCPERFRIIGQDGEERPPRKSEEMHEILKFYYNPVTVITPRGAFQSGSTTTALNDRDFIGEYMETIMADFSNPPYNCDFMLYDEWREMMKAQKNQPIY